MIEIGKHIKCVFKNGTIIEGIVKDWSPGNVQIESLNDQSIMIIMHPDEDIMLIKVLPEQTAEEPKTGDALREEIAIKLKEAREENPELQEKPLKELRQLVITQEKQIIANKIKEHFPSAYKPHKPNYGSQMDLLPPGRRSR